jgi:L-fuconolactonase
MSSAPASVASPVRREQPEPPSSKQLGKASRPYFETCSAAFGAERRMFASNFPVDEESFSYAAYWNGRKRRARRRRRRSSAAARFYRIA